MDLKKIRSTNCNGQTQYGCKMMPLEEDYNENLYSLSDQ